LQKKKEVFTLQLIILIIDGILLNGSIKKVISKKLQQKIFLRKLGAKDIIQQAENMLYQTKRLFQYKDILHQNKNVSQSKDTIYSKDLK
jgi:hypothetical protein